ncbi:MAG TPA: peptide chain release factor N(5)-glutamine methyltransferase [Pyrinomonadaceae bacterium]|nr:peptide chain release factor N(5)-glutamine methyltransferase [Pyrinomonadaceae bacterium]
MNISEILKKATEILREGGIVEARREANSLLAFALGKDRTFLIAHSEYELSDEEILRFQAILERRKHRDPFQYIVGTQEFYGLDFIVTNDVLIPRPETELIVENALEMLKTAENSRFLEIGVGSGCISVSILHEAKTATAIAVDVSEKALQIALKNADKHQVSDRLELKISNIFSEIKTEKFDLIVSNPPYIDERDFAKLQPEVRDFEPEFALTDGENGLSIIEKIIKDAPQFLKSKGFLLIEIGFNQSDEVRKICSPEVWQSIEFLSDLQGIPRTLKARLSKKSKK